MPPQKSAAKGGKSKFPRIEAAKAALKEGRKSEAVVTALRAIERDSAPAALVLSVARILRSEGLDRLALAVTEALVSENPANSELHLLRARCHVTTGDTSALQEALALAEANAAKPEEIEKIRAAATARQAKRDIVLSKTTA